MKVKQRKLRNQLMEVQILFAAAKRINLSTRKDRIKSLMTDVKSFLNSYDYFEENEKLYFHTRKLFSYLECLQKNGNLNILEFRNFVEETLKLLKNKS